MKALKDQNGFTLIELLVVIAILALLAGIAAPRVVGVYADSNSKKITAEVEMVQLAVDRWYLDKELNGNVKAYPIGDTAAGPTSDAGVATPDKTTLAVLDFADELSPYVKKAPANSGNFYIGMDKVVAYVK